MSTGVIVMVLGAFLVGGAISLHQQRKPLWTVVLLAVIAVGLIGYGWYAWFVNR